jgi:Cu/Ag efflux pump CusA
MLVAAAAAALVFFLLQAAVQNWQLAFALLVSLLAAMCGGMLAVLAAEGTVTLGSLAGLLAVFGLAARGCLVTVNRTGLIGAEAGTLSTDDVAKAAAGERFWPLVTSAIAVALAFAPAALAGDAAGLEIIQPMALVVMGGLVSSVLVNLFVIPTLLCHLPVKPQLQLVGEERYAQS